MKIKLIVIAVMFLAFGAITYTSQAYASDDDSDSDSDCNYGCDNDDDSDGDSGGGDGGDGGSGGDGGDGGDATGGNATGGDATGGDATGGNATGGVGTANNEGIDVQVDASDNSTTTTENNSSNIVLVPNNNTEKCLRVWGIAWGKDGQSGALGIPWRSAPCDFEGAADDAFAQGEREIGWFWKCQNKNLYKRFKDKGESNQDASVDCLDQMLGSMTATHTITTQMQTINSMTESARVRESLYESQEQELKQACSNEKNIMLKACVTK